MAQVHEVEAFLGGNWNEADTAELVSRIDASGSEAESDWVAICQQFDGTLDVVNLAEVKAQVRSAVRASVWAGMPEAEAARAFGVDRMTVRKWVGK